METEKGLFKNAANSKVKFLPNHNSNDAIGDIVDSDGYFKFREHVKPEERLTILNWLESQGVKVVVK